FEYFYSDSSGDIALRNGALAAQAFPQLHARLQSAHLYADIPAGQQFDLRLSYYYERLSTSDWALDGLLPDSLPAMLSLGATSPDYAGAILSVSFRYHFAKDTDR
ncbi:MAG: MtrB/PioB family outer membrane beta-barrel protein, partial [Gammaproteobacteria bacterium]|nr:MtrB/PioB family outer membrane beta-barrel protein [Gammaproteobacteria bacterium]